MADKAYLKSKGNTGRRANHRNNGKPSGIKGHGILVQAALSEQLLGNNPSLTHMIRVDKLIRRWTRQRI